MNFEHMEESSLSTAADGRTKRLSLFSHASVQVLSERAYQKTASKIREWRKNIISSEKKRLRRTGMDMYVKQAIFA